MSYIQELRIHGGSDGKEPACHVGNLSSIPGLGRSPGEGNGNPLQYSCLENSADRGAWWATVHGVAERDMTEQLTQTKQTEIQELIGSSFRPIYCLHTIPVDLFISFPKAQRTQVVN